MPRTALSKISIAQVVAELKKRQSKLADLVRQRDALNTQISQLQGLLGTEPTVVQIAKRGVKGRGRAGGKSLAQYVHEMLAAVPKGMSIADLEKRILAAGYLTSAKRIYKQVVAVLAKGGFKRIGRGIYVVKAMAKAGRAAAKPKAGRKRGTFKQTAEQFILGMLKAKPLSTRDVNAAWKKVGRAGSADVTLGKLVKAGKLKREKLPKGQKGSTYALA